MKHTLALLTALLLAPLAALTAAAENDQINLAGEWGVRLDPGSIGEKEAWWQQSFSKFCKLPGSLMENGLGDKVGFATQWAMHAQQKEQVDRIATQYLDSGKFLVTPWLNPGTYYVGHAWYQKEVNLQGREREWTLFLERTHWATMVWVNDRKIGYNNSLLTPHEYTFTASGKCRITILVDNRRVQAIGNPAHSFTDHTQGACW